MAIQMGKLLINQWMEVVFQLLRQYQPEISAAHAEVHLPDMQNSHAKIRIQAEKGVRLAMILG